MFNRVFQLAPTSPMLSQALRTRTRQHTSIFRLHLHQYFNGTLSSTLQEGDTPKPASDLLKNNNRRTAFIETWEPFRNLADAWALLRAVEHKYGKVEEAQFLKDWEITTKYQMYSYVVFRDQESVGNIPRSGYTFHIPAPVIDDRPGGLGLDDIRHLLDGDRPFEFQSVASLDTRTLGRVIGGRIKRAPKDFYTIPKLQIVPNEGLKRQKRLATQFLRWRGFHELEPIEASKDVRESEWLERPDLEQVRMRAALQWCARIAGRPNPAVICKLTAHENDGKESDSNPASVSMNSPESSLPESSSPTTLDIPTSHESTSKSTQSSSLPTELPQPPSQSSPEVTQLPPEPTPPKPIIPPSGQLTPEQKKTTQKQLMIKTKQPAAREAGKPKKQLEEEPKDQMLDKSPEEQQQSKSITGLWKIFGR